VPATRLTGVVRAAVCHPELVSEVKVTRDRRTPELLQRLPVWVPLFSTVL
jgi:hypothetical protein